MFFEPIIFFHAVYVAFAYSCLAFGATIYRNIVDDMKLREISQKMLLGEDMHYYTDPFPIFAVGILAIFFVCTSVIVLQFPAKVQTNVVPLAIAVNIVQIFWRARHQRMILRTNSIIGRKLLGDDIHVIQFDRLHVVDIERKGLYSYVTFLYEPLGIGERADAYDPRLPGGESYRRVVFSRSLVSLLEVIRTRTQAKIFEESSSKMV